jgi:hypothetical protein
MLGVIVAVREVGELAGSGVNVLVVQTTLKGDAGLSTNVLGSGMVIIRPVASTVGVTVGSLDVRVKVVPAGKAAPLGERVPV